MLNIDGFAVDGSVDLVGGQDVEVRGVMPQGFAAEKEGHGDQFSGGSRA